MTDENQELVPAEADAPQPDPDDFPLNDESDPEMDEADLPTDSFDESVADFKSEGEPTE